MRFPKPAYIRFWRRVRLSPGCWVRTNTLRYDGYSMFSPGDGARPVLAHRWLWEWANGEPVPDGLHVLHSCDNRACVRPTHLRVGSHQDNMNDRTERGRGYRVEGVLHPLARLTEGAVLDIRSRRAEGESVTALAVEYGVSKSAVSAAASGKTWRHLSLGGLAADMDSAGHRRCRDSAPDRGADRIADTKVGLITMGSL